MHAWRSYVIEKECLYTPCTIELDIRNTAPSRDAESALIEARELVLVTVKRAGQVYHSTDLSVVTLAIDVLNVLVRVEREIVGGKSQRLLGVVVGLPHPLSVRPKDVVQRLLLGLLDYHTKTHMVYAYILTLLTASLHSARPSRSPRGLSLYPCMT